MEKETDCFVDAVLIYWLFRGSKANSAFTLFRYNAVKFIGRHIIEEILKCHFVIQISFKLDWI